MNRPTNVIEGVTQGFKIMSDDLSDGFTNLVNEPSQGWEKDGTKGALEGLKNGMISASLHSVTGFSKMGIKTLEGTVSSVENLSCMKHRKKSNSDKDNKQH